MLIVPPIALHCHVITTKSSLANPPTSALALPRMHTPDIALEHEARACWSTSIPDPSALREVDDLPPRAPWRRAVEGRHMVHRKRRRRAFDCGRLMRARGRNRGHAGYYVAGMNKLANVRRQRQRRTRRGGKHDVGHRARARLRVDGAGASARGGLLVIQGDAALRCGISLKGADIVVGGGVGSFSAFMAQAGRMVVCGDAGDGLGDSLYEAVIYVRGEIRSLGADARVEPMTRRRLRRRARVARARPGSTHVPRIQARRSPRDPSITGTPTPNQEY